MADAVAPDSATGTAPTKVFLSYARGDDEPFVRRLYEGLSARGFEVWFDRESMPSRQLTFHQEIIDAIAAHDRFVLVVGPKAAESEYVIQEWRYAYEMDKPVKCVLRLGEESLVPDELKLIDYSDFRDDGRFDAELDKLARQLSEPPAPLGKLISVPSLPRHLLARTDRVRALKDAVLADLMNPTVITGAAGRAGIHGMGGIGKSVLATMLARDREVRRAFPDGVAWVTIGEEPSITALQREVIGALGGNTIFDTASEGKQRLKDVLETKAVLLVLDDVWDGAHAEAFDALGPRCRVTMTTRDASLITAMGGTQHEVELLGEREALTLLAQWAEKELDTLPEIAATVADECGYLPLALSICGAMVRDGQPWDDVLEALQEADLEYLEHPHGNIMKSIKISIDRLDADQRERFSELAVFPTDQTIPEAAVHTLWAHTGGLKSRHSSKLLSVLERKSLLRLDTDITGENQTRRMSLHDLLHDYALGMTDNSVVLHKKLLDAYHAQCLDGWASGPNDGYFFENLCAHFASAGKVEVLREVLTDYRFLQAKLDASGPQSLVEDYDQLSPDSNSPLGLIQGALRLSMHILKEDPAQLASQLHGRMVGFGDHAIAKLLEDAAASQTGLWLRPVQPCATVPGGPLLHTLKGHTDAVTSVSVTPNGALAVSASADKTVKVWDLGTGDNLRTLEGHTGTVRSVAVTTDANRAVSASFDKTIKLWDLTTGDEIRTLEGHTDVVTAVAVTPDNTRALSGSSDNTLKVWDLKTGDDLRTLRGHKGAVNSVAVTADGVLAVSASADKTIKVWDLETGNEIRTLKGHTDVVTSVAVTADGTRAVSGSWDKTVKVWDLKTGNELRSLVGHALRLWSVAVTTNGSVAFSASDDRTLKVWDIETGNELRSVGAHSDRIMSVEIFADGTRGVSASWDNTLKVWDLKAGDEPPVSQRHAFFVPSVGITSGGTQAVSISTDGTLKVWDLKSGDELYTRKVAHADAAKSVATTADGTRAVTASFDKTLKVWDLNTGDDLRTLQAHTDKIMSVAMTADGTRAVSGSVDKTLRVWDVDTGGELLKLQGHSDIVTSVAVTEDGIRAVSASWDKTLKAWDLKTGNELRTFDGHAGRVKSIAVTADGALVLSGSGDNTLKVWDLQTGDNLRTLRGHKSAANSVAMTSDGALAVSASGDNTLKVWDIKTGHCLATFSCDAHALACAISVDGRTIVASDQDCRICFLRLEGFEFTKGD